MTDTTDHIATALAAFHKDLPDVSKGSVNPAFNSKYADLADIVKVVLPALAEHGLAWTTIPTLTEHGFVLQYELRHESGQAITGSWPLPDPEKTSPQNLGGAVTYGKRYALSAVVGVAPDADDDGNAVSEKGAPRYRKPSTKQRIAQAKAAVDAAESLADLAKVWDRVRAGGLEGIAELVTAHEQRVTELQGTVKPDDPWTTPGSRQTPAGGVSPEDVPPTSAPPAGPSEQDAYEATASAEFDAAVQREEATS